MSDKKRKNKKKIEQAKRKNKMMAMTLQKKMKQTQFKHLLTQEFLLPNIKTN